MKKFKFWLVVIVFLFLFANNSRATTDSNLSNNKMNVTVDVVDTKNLYLRFVPIDNPDSGDYDNEVASVSTFIEATFPISDTGSRVYFQSAYATTIFERNHLKYLMWKIDKSSLLSGNINRVVGIVPPNWFLNTSQPPGTRGVSWVKDFVDSVLIEITNLRHVAPHEIGHTFDLCDENSNASWKNHDDILFFECPNGDIDEDNTLDSSCPPKGCPVSTLGIVVPWVESNNALNLKNFMGYNYNDSDVWLSTESYNHLLKKFDKSIFSEITLFKAGIVAGFIDKNDSGDLGSIYIIENRTMTDISELGNGSYSVILKDNEENVIQNFTFEPSFLESSFNGSVTETNISYFLFVMNLTENVTKIILKRNSTILEQINKTSNTPTVNITYPPGGEILENPFNITWTASDVDGGNIYYAILISDDGGSNYTTLDIDLNQTYYELDPNDFDYGTNYVVKVLATDGVNTGTNVSDTFILGNPFKITSLSNITINNTHMLFEFVINNTGSTTLNNINWTLNPGDGSSLIKSSETFNLTSGASAFVYVEYNYTTQSDFVVNATANSGTLTSSKNLSINLGNATPSNLDVYNFSMYNISSTYKIFQFLIKNIATNQNLTGISWSLNTGLGTINSIYAYNLTPNNFSYVFVEYNYTQTGDFTPIASASSDSNQDSETLPAIDIPDIEASNLSLIYNDSTYRVFFFTITNMLSSPLTNVNWTFDTKNNNVITANQSFSLNSSKEAFIFIEYNYSSTGTYTVNATAINGSLKDSTYYEFTIS